MGVNLTPIVTRREITLEDLRGRVIAIDGNAELYQFLSIMRARDGSPLRDSKGRVTSHLNGLVFRTTRLIADHGIRPVFVFDGPPPELKRRTIEARRRVRERAAAEYDRALRAGDLGVAWSKAVTATRLTREMVDDARVLLGLIGIPVVQAPSEGEAQAAWLVQKDLAWAVGSKDYDSLLFGAPRLVRFLAVGSREFLPSKGVSRPVQPELIELSPWLHEIGLTREQLVDVAILIGTDFNEGVRGVGPKTAVKMIRSHGSIDAIPDDIRSQLTPRLDEIRAFFLQSPTVPDQISRGALDRDAVVRFLCDERGFSPARVALALDRLGRKGTIRTQIDDFLGEFRESVK